MQTRTTHQSLQRAVEILRTFTEADPTLTVGEVAQRTGFHKSTCSRILSTLLSEGLVVHDETSGRYSLGLGLVGLAGVALGQVDVRRAALPHIDALAHALDETVSVSVLRGDEAVTVAWSPGSHSIRHVVWIGRRVPLDRTAAGRVLSASRSAGGASVHALDPHTPPTDPNRVVDPGERLVTVTADGIAVEVDTFEIGTTAIAVPIEDAKGTVVAALSVGGPTDRFDGAVIDRAGSALRRTAGHIAAELGLRREVPA